MRRRTFLATAATAVALPLAGCAHPSDGSLSMGELTSDSAIAERYAGETEGLPPERKALIDAAVAGDAPTREGRYPPYDQDRPIEHEGAYYRITHEVVDSRTETRYTVDVDYDPETTPSSVIAYEDLPEADKRALGELIPPEEDHPDNDGFDIGRSHRYEDVSESVLASDPAYEGISHEGSTYRVRVADDGEVTIETYEYSAEQVAESATDLGAQLREQHLFSLSGLSEAEREIVAEAIDGSYFPEGGEVPDAFRSLADRFRNRAGIDTNEHGGTWLARYEGTIYWTDLRYPPEADSQ